MTDVIIGNSVTSIGSNAFRGCTILASIVIPNNVKRIGIEAFYGCSSLTSVTIPNSITSIADNVFYNCRRLTSLTMVSPVPPTAVDETSFGTNYTTLYVPQGSLAAYQTTDVWKNFKKIEEYVPVGIEDVVFDTESSNLPIYNLQGVRMKDLDNLPSGIHIQGGKKFVVK